MMRNDCIQPCELNRAAISDDSTYNYETVGLPAILGAEQARVRPVQLAANSGPIPLTFRVDPTNDFYLDGISCALWSVSGGALTWVNPVPGDPATGVASPVSLELFDTAGLRISEQTQIHWSNVAGFNGNIHWLGLPRTISAGNTFTVNVYNADASTVFAISLQLHGRKVRIKKSRDGQPIVNRTSMGRGRHADIDDPRYLTGDIEQNRWCIGEPHALGILDQPLAMTAGTYAAPAIMASQTLRIDARYDFYVRYLMSQQTREGTSLDVANQAQPIFVRIFDEYNQYWLNNIMMPVNCMFGDGKFKTQLPIDWLWPRGAAISVEFINMTSTVYQMSVCFEGWIKVAKHNC
jgi:hypothetical protein